MDHKDLERDLEKLKNGIPVNRELKHSLRKGFLIKRRNMWIKRMSTIAAALIIVFTAVLISDNINMRTVKADAFKISNQISYAEISSGNGLQINEHNGVQYITIYEKGIFRYDSTGYHSIYEGEVNSAKLSMDGKKFIISANGSIILFDIESKNKTELLRGDNSGIYIDEPSWAEEDQILYTRKVMEPVEPHGFGVKETSIYRMDINSLKSEKIADGSNASFAACKNAVVFERDNKIIYKNLKDGSERIIDDGRFPNVSPDGRYIAYVKYESSVENIGENASVSKTISNVWITDTEDFQLKQAVTFNFVNEYMDEDAWLKSLEKEEDKSVPKELVYSGAYDYYNPVWSSNSKSLFIVKFLLGQGQGNSKIVRIDFTDQNLTRIDTVKRYIQALIARDEDYASSLMKNPPEILTISNPRQSGYNIISDGKDEAGDYVEAEVYWYYTGTPYYSIERSKYYLSQNENGYIIDSIKLLDRTEVYFKNSSMYLNSNNEERELFNENSIPAEYYLKGKSQLQSAAYNTKTDSIIFTSYDYEKSHVNFIEYNIASGEFKLVDKLEEINNEKAMGTSYLALDSTGKYAAADVYYGEGENIRNTIVIYNLSNNQKINIGNIVEGDLNSFYIGFWEEGRLIFSGIKDNEEVKYMYDPEKNALSIF